MGEVNESTSFFQLCSLLKAEKEVIVKYPSQAHLIYRISVCVFFLLLTIPAVTLNGVSVITILKCPQLKQKIAYFLLMMQSITDLTVGLISLPALGILGLLTATTGSVHCVGRVLMSRLIPLLVLVSTLTLFTMTMERYFGVLHPLKHRTLITKKRILVFFSCGASLMFAIATSSIIFGNQMLNIATSISMATLLFVAAFVYTKIFKVIRNKGCPGNPYPNNISAAEQPSSNRQSSRNFLKDIKLVKSCYLAVVCFSVCFLAGIVTAVPFSFSTLSWEVFRSWSTSLIMLNSSLNSIIFFWNRPLLRNEAKKVLKNLCKPAN